jgi:hypothetical protein
MAMTTLAPLSLTSCSTNEEIVALLATNLVSGGEGTEGSPSVHRADVLSADPADVVSNLIPAQGTDKGDRHGSVWYLLCSKRYKSDAAGPYGKRLRSIRGGKMCWHAEAGPKKVEVLVDGKPMVGCFRTFTYGCKLPPPAKQFKRLGWCMVEYAVEGYEEVLCKVYRSPRAKKAWSTSYSAVLAPSPPSKRKAAGDDPEAPLARLGAHQAQETRLSCDAPMHGDDNFPFVTGNLPMPIHDDALEVAFPVQHSAGPQGHNGYALAEGAQPGAGPVLGGIDYTGSFSNRFFFDDKEAPTAVDFEELLNQQLHDPLAYQEAEATWAPPPLDDSFFSELPPFFGPF